MVSLLYNNTNCMTNLDIDYRDIYRLIPTLPPPESINISWVHQKYVYFGADIELSIWSWRLPGSRIVQNNLRNRVT